jgi:hypothetical protein
MGRTPASGTPAIMPAIIPRPVTAALRTGSRLIAALRPWVLLVFAALLVPILVRILLVLALLILPIQILLIRLLLVRTFLIL